MLQFLHGSVHAIRLVLAIFFYFLCETSTWHLDSCPPEGAWYGVILWVLRVLGQGLKSECADILHQSFLWLLRHTDEPQKGWNSCLWLQSRSVVCSFGVLLMSCRVKLHVVRSALQYSACRILYVYVFSTSFSTFFNDKSKSCGENEANYLFKCYSKCQAQTITNSRRSRFPILRKIQEGNQDGDYAWWRHRPLAALPPIEYTSSCREDQRLSTKGKIVLEILKHIKNFMGIILSSWAQALI